jgi:glycine betaine transporter
MQTALSAGFILAIVLWGVISPDTMGPVFETALATVTRNFGWFYLWVVLGMVVFVAFLAFSRYGNLKLGGDDDEP